MLIVYSNGRETLVCQHKDEKRVLKEWFDEACRDIEDYDREEMEICTLIEAEQHVTGE
ncbi:MAG TPA: hypothetical protein VMW91_03750 [Desulfosporosinus sp.]|nr:hypothetical protein [Desulfosporosinus sp.]